MAKAGHAWFAFAVAGGDTSPSLMRLQMHHRHQNLSHLCWFQQPFGDEGWIRLLCSTTFAIPYHWLVAGDGGLHQQTRLGGMSTATPSSLKLDNIRPLA